MEIGWPKRRVQCCIGTCSSSWWRWNHPRYTLHFKRPSVADARCTSVWLLMCTCLPLCIMHPPSILFYISMCKLLLQTVKLNTECLMIDRTELLRGWVIIDAQHFILLLQDLSTHSTLKELSSSVFHSIPKTFIIRKMFCFPKAFLISCMVYQIKAKKPPGFVVVRTFKCGTTTLKVRHCCLSWDKRLLGFNDKLCNET